MAICERCGAPLDCQLCTPRDGISLLLLPQHLRADVLEFMDSLGTKTAQDESRIVKQLLAYSEAKIRYALRIWKMNSYGGAGKGEKYFMAILKRVAVGNEPKLEPLPDIFDPRKHGGIPV